MTTFGASDIQALIDAGYGYAADVLGDPYDIYRASSATNPLAAENWLGFAVKAKFDPNPGFNHGKPADFGKPLYYALTDTTALQPGDYFVGAQGTYFLAGIERNAPRSAVRCNRVISLSRPAGTSGLGKQPYGGGQRSTATALLTSWPCWIGQGTKGESTATKLPGDVRAPWVDILMPAYASTALQFGDYAADDLGRHYVVSSAEVSWLGVRMTASYAET